MAERRLPVLMYHGLHANAQAHGVFDPVYSVEPRCFEQQLDWLLRQGYRTLRLREIDTPAATDKAVVITFDDGDVSNREIALPLLLERGMTAEFFVTSDFVGLPGRLSTDDVRALASAGMGVQSHGATHRYLSELTLPELEAELRRSRQLLESITGCSVDALALPGGRGGERERLTALRLGYQRVLNSAPGANASGVRDVYLQRLAITRGLALDQFATLVQWRGARARASQLRYLALTWLKRSLGNRRYEQLRERVLR